MKHTTFSSYPLQPQPLPVEYLGVPPSEDTETSECRLQIAQALEHPQYADRASALKALYQSWLSQMREGHAARQRALFLCQQLSGRIDLLLTALAAELLQKPAKMSEKFCMIAVAGYGRAEMYPHSDIDLLILSETPLDQAHRLEQALQNLLYPLWDIGLQVGNSIQTPASALKLALEDQTFASALFEMRFICGDAELYQQFYAQHQQQINNRHFRQTFLQKKQAEKIARHDKHCAGRATLEPNLKEGIGALRDLHYIRWVSVALCGTADPVQAGLWDAQTQVLYARTYGQLTEFRLAKHFFLSANENRLLQHVQPAIAEHLHYRHHQALRPIERMMKWYFHNRSRTILLGEVCDQTLAEQKYLPAIQPLPIPATSVNAQTLLQYLQKCRDTEAQPCAHALRQLLHAKPLFCRQPTDAAMEIRHLLRELLCKPTKAKNFRSIAALLHHSGILGWVMPEYQHVAGLTQTDGYHAYPVGIHTLQVIEHLHGMAEADPHSPHTKIDALLLQHHSPELLFFAALLHDIAKGRGGQHAQRGAEIAKQLAPKFGFSLQDTDTIAWLVREHLLLSDLALKRDILDAGTAQALVEATPDIRCLDLLYCLTTADIRAVAPQSWNTWKATVIGRLHEAAQSHLSPELSPHDRKREREKAIAQLRESLPDLPEELFAAHIHRCASEYLFSTTLPLQIEHARLLIDAHPIPDRECALLMLPDTEDEIVRLVVYTANYTGLVAHTVGVLTEAGFSIVTLKTFPYGERGAVLTVWFHLQGKVLTEARRLNRIKDRLETAIRERYITFAQQPNLAPNIATETPRIILDNSVSRRSTVIEVQTLNRARLLFDLCNALSETRLQIVAAKIDTIGQRARDVFYVRDRFGHKILASRHQSAIHAQIKKHLSRPA